MSTADPTAALQPGDGRRTRIAVIKVIVIAAIVAALVTVFQLTELLPDNAIRFVASEVTCLLGAIGWLLVLLVDVVRTRRTRWKIVGGLVAVAAIFFATFTWSYGGNMQPYPKPRPWAYRFFRWMGLNVGVGHASRRAELQIEPGPDDSHWFLGPTRDGVYKFSGKLGRDWSQPPREVWRARVGPGWSSFAIAGRYGFTQEQTSDEQFEQVTCYDLTDGSVQWVHSDEPGYDWFLGGKGPRATPAYHDGRLFALGSNGLLNCLEAATGVLLWSHDLLKENGSQAPQWGKSSSPIVVSTKAHGAVVVVSVGDTGGKSLAAYQVADGRPVWQAGDDESGYATPITVTLGGVPQIVIVNWQSVVGHDPETGAVLWRYDAWQGSQPKVPQPIDVNDGRRLFISAGYGVGSRMLEITKDAAGKWSVDETWKSIKFKPKFMNPVTAGGYVYGLDDGEFLMCVELATGDVKWRSPRGSKWGHGQVLLVDDAGEDDVLIVQSEFGDVALVAADPSGYKLLGRFTAIPDGTSWNVPVLWGKYLLVRNDNWAACYELPVVP